MMHGWYGGFGWIGMILGAVIWLALLVGIILLIVYGIRRLSRGSSSATSSSKSTAKEILQERYARGEVTREQYQQMLEDLGK
ncbi:protein containg short C-terminal domain [Longilinea arvoryzae]|uniref:Protein containg short C-terminal domain n=1 Tax=Longilinea arvoryzae TaxID=360412 RepID=A0A0S7BCU5_9CHLR|nr:SHOCT domain-containing protein [Longilinea arvoryzae]GAP15695.1 protein containg short C-terminal domain [Longilinea arvoryzae]